MAVPAGGTPSEIQTGDTVHFLGGMAIDFLTGTFVKSVSAAGLVTYQDSAGAEMTAQLAAGGGGSITSGTGNPSGGNAGDIYLQLNAFDVVQSIWVNVAGTWTEYPVPAGGGTSAITRGAGFPAVADAAGSALYGNQTPTAEALGFLKLVGETHESTFRTAYLGNGFYGFADSARDFGTTRFKRGGDVAPLPAGLLAFGFHVASTLLNTMFIDVDTAAGLFMAELTSVTVTVTQEDGTQQIRLLDNVQTPETGVRRFLGEFAITRNNNLFEAGEFDRISFVLSGQSDPIDIHGGTDVAEVFDAYNIQAERAEIHREIAPIDAQVEVNTFDIERLKAQSGQHDEVTEIFDSTILGRDLFGGGVGASGILWIDWFGDNLYGVSATHANRLQLPIHPDGGATRDGEHWYLIRDNVLDVFNANLSGAVRSSTTLSALQADDTPLGMATDADLTTGLASHVWIMHYDASEDELAITTVVPDALGSVSAGQTFVRTLAQINTLMGDDFVDLTDLTDARDIAVRGSQLFILFDDLETTLGRLVSAIAVFSIGGSDNALTLAPNSVRTEDVTLNPRSLVEAPGGFLYLADGSDVYRFREGLTGIGVVRNITGQGGPTSSVYTKDDLQVDNDQPGAWISGRRKIVSTNPLGVFNFFSQSNYLGEFPNDTAADSAHPAPDVGEWYWETTHHKARRQNFIPNTGNFWEDANILTLFGTAHQHVWLGVSATELAALLKINDFDTDRRYVGEVRGDLVQLDNDTFVPGEDEYFEYPATRLVLADEIAEGAAKDALFTYNIAEGHDIDDTSANSWEGNIYLVERDGQIDDFAMWVNPQIIEEYLGYIQRMARHGDEDYRPVAALLEADSGVTTTGAGLIELTYSYSTPLDVYAGDYLWVGVSLGASGSVRGRQQADATVTDPLGILTFVDHSKFSATPTTADNLWHTNPDNYSYRQEIRGTFISEDELVVQRNGVPVYSGKNVIDVDTTDDDSLEVSADKVTLHLPAERVIVSEDTPPDAADVLADDLTKLYLHINADGVIQSISYILDVDSHIFSLTSEEYTPVTQEYRGFRLAGNYGYLVPRHNIVVMEHETDSISVLELQFEQGVTEPFDYRDFGAGLTLYRRLKSSTGNWSHHNMPRDNSDHYTFEGGTSGGFFGSNNRYDVILRIGQFGDGTSATVPAANRLESYPGGIKREYFPTFDQIDSITRLYDIVREIGLDDGVADDLALDVTGDVLTVTIGRTVGADLVATVTLPAGGVALGTADPVDVGTTAVGVSPAAAHEDHGHGVPALTVAENLPDFFHVPMDQTTVETLTTAHINILAMTDASVIVNRGGFAIVAGTNSRNAVQIPADGNYTVEVNAYADLTGGTNARGRMFGEIVVMRAGAFVTALGAVDTQYYRNDASSGDSFLSIVHTVDLEANDEIEFRVFGAQAYSSTFQYGATGSEISIRRNVGTPTVSGVGAGGSNGQRLRHEVIQATPVAVATTDVTTLFTAGTHEFVPFTFAEVDPAAVQEINLIFQRNGDSERSVRISRNDFLRIGFADPAPSWTEYSSLSTYIIPAYVSMGNSGRNTTRNDFLRPAYDRANEIRSDGTGQIDIFFIENANGMMEEIQIYANAPDGPADPVVLTRADIVLQENIP